LTEICHLEQSNDQTMSQNVTLSAMISAAQSLAVEALPSGSTVTEAAERAGVARETVSRWVHRDPGPSSGAVKRTYNAETVPELLRLAARGAARRARLADLRRLGDQLPAAPNWAGVVFRFGSPAGR
jgi:transposase-like protein